MNISSISQMIPALIPIIGFIIVIGVYITKVNRNTKDISKLDNRYYTLHKDLLHKLNEIYDRLPKKIDSFTSSHSPISLNKQGHSASKKLGVYDTVKRNYQAFSMHIFENNIDTLNPYDIQQKSIKVIREKLLSLMTEEEKETLKTFAFKEGVEIEDFFTMYGIILRDLIFEEKNINIKDVDKHSSQK